MTSHCLLHISGHCEQQLNDAEDQENNNDKDEDNVLAILAPTERATRDVSTKKSLSSDVMIMVVAAKGGLQNATGEVAFSGNELRIGSVHQR